MSNLRLSFLCCALAASLLACRSKPSAPQGALDVPAHIGPDELQARLRAAAPEQMDATYRTIFKKWGDHDRPDLVAAHLQRYEQQRGAVPEAQAGLLNARAFLLQYAGKLDSAQALYRDALDWAEKNARPADRADALRGLSTNHYYRGEYAKSTETLLQAMAEYRALGDSASLNYLKLEQCGNLFRSRECEQMLALARSALPMFERERDTFYIATVHNIIGLYFECSSKLDSAIFWHKKALAMRAAVGDLRGEGESLNNIAVLFVHQKQYADAMDAYRQAIELMEKAGDRRNVSILQSNLGRCFQNMGDHAAAIRQYKIAAQTLSENGQLDAVVINLERLAGAYRQSEDFRAALNTYLESRQWRDSLFNDQKQKTIQELNVKFETALKEQKIARLEAQRRSNQLWLSLLFVGFALLLTGAAFYIFRLRQKQKLLAREKQLAEMREQAQAKDLEIAQLEIGFNRRQLDEAASNLSEKSRLVEELREGLDALRQSLGETHMGEEVQRSLSMLYGMKILTDGDWNDFRVQFEQVYPGLIKRLRQHFPDLADAELRLVLLLKMGVRSREIATMLGISPDSVKKTRYRLRKRLNLDEHDSLEAFIEAFQ